MHKVGKQGLTDIYVVGCGPSLKSFNWESLQNKTTIAINGSLQDVPNPDYFLTADSWFAGRAVGAKFWHVQTYKVLVMGEDHSRFARVKTSLSLWDYHIIPKRFNGDIGFSESEFCTGQNSGFCGMQLAVILGAKRIHLLGMDFFSEKGIDKGNYHGRYPSNPSKLNEFLLHFKTAISTLASHDIEVISHSIISRLNDMIAYEPFLR